MRRRCRPREGFRRTHPRRSAPRRPRGGGGRDLDVGPAFGGGGAERGARRSFRTERGRASPSDRRPGAGQNARAARRSLGRRMRRARRGTRLSGLRTRGPRRVPAHARLDRANRTASRVGLVLRSALARTEGRTAWHSASGWSVVGAAGDLLTVWPDGTQTRIPAHENELPWVALRERLVTYGSVPIRVWLRDPATGSREEVTCPDGSPPSEILGVPSRYHRCAERSSPSGTPTSCPPVTVSTTPAARRPSGTWSPARTRWPRRTAGLRSMRRGRSTRPTARSSRERAARTPSPTSRR